MLKRAVTHDAVRPLLDEQEHFLMVQLPKVPSQRLRLALTDPNVTAARALAAVAKLRPSE